MAKKNTDQDSQLPGPLLRKPEPVPDWLPSTSETLTINDVVREMAVIGFDRSLDPKERLSALKELGKHKGMFVERSESRHVDATQVEVAKEMFSQMNPDERRKWLEEHLNKVEANTIPVRNVAPPDPPPSAPAPKKSNTLKDLHGK